MKIDKIITMANQRVKLRFLAMERSLRAVGCDLPLLVIPYDDNLFELPKGSTWWQVPEIINWLKAEKARPVMKKYQCLTVGNYQFVDADICFLRNPETVLEPYSGFITSCVQWNNQEDTYSEESRQLMSYKTTTWQKNVFNSGQFACDRALYGVDELIATAMRPELIGTCVRCPFHEQPGMNLLTFESGVKITNVTLPPSCMESTWAGDYPDEYEHYWTDPQRKPYIIHWAGIPMDVSRPINQIFYSYLTAAEKAEWDEQVQQWILSCQKRRRSARGFARRFKFAFQTFKQIDVARGVSL